MNAQNTENKPRVKRETKNKIRVEFDRTPAKGCNHHFPLGADGRYFLHRYLSVCEQDHQLDYGSRGLHRRNRTFDSQTYLL